MKKMLLVALLGTAACGGSSKSTTATPITAEAPAKADIVDTAVAAGSFKTLATALEAAGLIETLKGSGPFTVFAPTDEAFAKLPPAPSSRSSPTRRSSPPSSPITWWPARLARRRSSS